MTTGQITRQVGPTSLIKPTSWPLTFIHTRSEILRSQSRHPKGRIMNNNPSTETHTATRTKTNKQEHNTNTDGRKRVGLIRPVEPSAMMKGLQRLLLLRPTAFSLLSLML